MNPSDIPEDRKITRTDPMMCVRIECRVKKNLEAASGFVMEDDKWDYYFEGTYGEAELAASPNRFRIGEVVLVKHSVTEIAYMREDEPIEVDGISLIPVVEYEPLTLEEEVVQDV